MQKEDSIVLFKQHQVRRHWDDEQELWYFSVVDVIEILTGSNRPRKYWNDLKKKLSEEGSELSEKIGQLKMFSSDGKRYLADIADTEGILRLVQSMVYGDQYPQRLQRAARVIKRGGPRNRE